MEDIQALIDQLKGAGLTPKVQISLPGEGLDVEQVKTLLNELQQAGIPAGIPVEVHIDIHLGAGGGSDSTSTKVVDGGPSFAVIVDTDKLNCLVFNSKDKAGKPIMEIREPRVQLFRGTSLNVSATFKAGDKDTGDGTVIGTGGIGYYRVTDCPTKPEAVGLFVRTSDVNRV